MAYVPAGPFNIVAEIFKSQKRLKTVTFANMPAPTVGLTSTTIITATSYFANDVAVTYDMKFAPSYYIPLQSKVTINFPTIFSHIDDSNPPATCTIHSSVTQYLENCVIGDNIVTLKVKLLIPELTELNIILTGIKNPSFEGKTGASDVNVWLKDTDGKQINYGAFNVMTYIAAKNVDSLYLVIHSSSEYQNTVSNYVFSI